MMTVDSHENRKKIVFLPFVLGVDYEFQPHESTDFMFLFGFLGAWATPVRQSADLIAAHCIFSRVLGLMLVLRLRLGSELVPQRLSYTTF